MTDLTRRDAIVATAALATASLAGAAATQTTDDDRKAIAEHGWADETEPLGSNAIDVQLSRIRAKLPSAGIRIVTVRGAGYRLEDA